jgi:hypothetical protein
MANELFTDESVAHFTDREARFFEDAIFDNR